jgi:hypothetical protein
MKKKLKYSSDLRINSLPIKQQSCKIYSQEDVEAYHAYIYAKENGLIPPLPSNPNAKML